MPPQVSVPVFARGRREASGSPPLASLLSRPAPGESPARSAVRLRPITLRGHGDGVVTLRKKDPGPTVVHITGNDAARFFGVRTLGSETDLLNTIDPYDGVRALDWEGRETTGFEVQATGAWTIEVLPVAAIPTIDSSFDGSGDMVLRCTGSGSTAKIVGNDAGRYFTVRVLGDHLPVRVVNATESYSGTFSIPDGHRLIAIEAVGPWTLSVT